MVWPRAALSGAVASMRGAQPRALEPGRGWGDRWGGSQLA